MTGARPTIRVALTAAVVLALCVAGCSGAHRATLRTNVDASMTPSIVTTAITVGHTYTLQAGNVCAQDGRVRIDSVEPVMTSGKLVVTAWGTRDPNSSDAVGEHDPAGARVSLASLGGFSHAAVGLACSSRPADRWLELNIEMHARSDIALASQFRVHYDHGRTLVVGFGYGMCSPTVTREGRCPHTPR